MELSHLPYCEVKTVLEFVEKPESVKHMDIKLDGVVIGQILTGDYMFPTFEIRLWMKAGPAKTNYEYVGRAGTMDMAIRRAIESAVERVHHERIGIEILKLQLERAGVVCE